MANGWRWAGVLGLWLWAGPVGAIEARTVQGELTADDQKAGDQSVDLYEFSGQAGDKVVIELISQDFDALITLFDSTPTLLARDNNSGGGTNSLLVFELPKTDHYVIAVTSALPNQLGSYELNWRSAMPADEQRAEASRLNQQAIQLHQNSRFRAAISILQQATELYRSAGDRVGEATTLTNIGTLHNSLGEYLQALEQYRQALAIFQALGERAGEGITLNGIGLVHNNFGEYSQALEQYRQALAIFQALGDRVGKGITLNNIGLVYDNQGEYPQALEQYRQALVIFQAVGNRAGESTTLNNIGSVYNNLDEYPQALEQYRQALAIFQALGDRAGEGGTLNNIGLVHNNLGEYLQALEHFRQALAIQKAVGNRAGEGTTLHNIGLVHNNLGEYPQALEHYRQALAIRQELRDRAGEGTTLHNIGSVYSSLGQYPQALEQYRQALAISQEVGDRAGEGTTLNNIGLVYQSLGQYPQALEQYRQALAIRQELGDRAGEGTTLNNIGAVYESLGQYPQALEQFRQALAIRQEVGDRAGEGTTLNNIGAVHNSLGQYPQALEQYRQALAIFQEVGNRADEGGVLNNIGHVLAKQEQPIAAISLFKQAVAVFESIRQNNLTLSPEQQETYTETVSSTYRELAKLLLAEGRLLEAQEVLDLLTLQEIRAYNQGTRATVNERGELEYTPLEAQIIEEHNSLIAFDHKVQECERTNCSEKAALVAQRTALNREFIDTITQAQIDSEARGRNDESTEDPILLARKAAPIVQQQPGTLLIQTFIQNHKEAANGKGKLWLLWVTGNTANKIERDIDYIDFANTVREFRDALNRPDSDTAKLQQLGKKLYDWIIAPLDTELQQNQIQHLIFRLDRELRYIPLAALHDGNQYLIERYTVANILTLATTNTDDRRSATPAGDRILALGKSEPYGNFDALPHVRDEIAAIVNNPTQGKSGPYPGDGYLDREFTSSALESNLFGRRLLHIATHGYFSPTNASGSYLLLGDNQELTLDQIQLLPHLHNLHLVVLSACQTALGGDPAGDHPDRPDGREINSLTHAFTTQDGAKAILASLWNVNDRSTSLLMQDFYRRMAADPTLTKAEALRQAQLAFARGELTRSGEVTNPAHPYYWSPFVLTGNSW